MRAIHWISPDTLPTDARILEVGGGRSGLAALLYPNASVTTVDIDESLTKVQPSHSGSNFVTGDACNLPFSNASFDIVTLFDVLEHISEDYKAAEEAMRVTKAGGFVLVSTPQADWRYPFYAFMAPFCPNERVLMEQWGHVRRGYTPQELHSLFRGKPVATVDFINRITAFYHDVAFSRLGSRSRKVLYLLAALPTAFGYALHGRWTRGTEIAAVWRR
jgi:SAM-dependent methyltransferase